METSILVDILREQNRCAGCLDPEGFDAIHAAGCFWRVSLLVRNAQHISAVDYAGLAEAGRGDGRRLGPWGMGETQRKNQQKKVIEHPLKPWETNKNVRVVFGHDSIVFSPRELGMLSKKHGD